MGNMDCGLEAALCHGPRSCSGPHAIGPASSQCSTRRRTRGLGGDGGYISRGPTPKAHSSPGKALPIIYLIAGVLSLPSIRGAVQEMLRRHEYGGVVIDTRTSPANIRNDLTTQADSVLVIRVDGSTESVRSTLVTEDFLKRVLNHR
jgi:hypothetical protein